MIENAVAFRKHELDEQIGEKAKNLLNSQRAFIFAPERFSAISGGFGSGKSFALVLKGLILSAAIPGNVGSFMCYRGSDVEKRLVPLFMEEVCPPAWRKSYNKNKRVAVLRNGSVISFDHIKDSTSGAASGSGTRRIGSNWGWFGVDQGEEIEMEQWDALASRLRLPRAPRKFGFMSLNPAGRDWIWERFFQKVLPWPKSPEGQATPIGGKFFQVCRQAANTLGICVNSEENRISNGGFVDDSYFDSLLQTYGLPWVERFVWGQFDDFKGKMFPDFSGGLVDYGDASVHVIDDFQIPKHWSLVTAIDVGGDSPWAVCPIYSDEQGNLILTPGFHNRTGRVSEVAAWIKRHTPWNENRTTYVIDPENKVATVELSDYGIYCQNAIKDINPGLLRMEGYLHVQKHRNLPHWYEETQPVQRHQKFRGHGSPKFFVFKSALVIRKELDSCKWDPQTCDKMYKSSTARFDAIEAIRYGVMTRPEPSKVGGIEDAEFIELEKKDRGTAAEWREYARRRAVRHGLKNNPLLNMDSNDDDSPVKPDYLGKLEQLDQREDW
jgi:hypothetical protein